MLRGSIHIVFFSAPVILHVGLLATAMILTLADPEPERTTTAGVGVVLEPIRDTNAYSRTIVTQTGELTFRRSCEAGRCELFAGTARGYTLLTSYPADRFVDLRTWPEVEITRIYEAEERRSSVTPWWLATAFSFVLALVVLGYELAGQRFDRERVESGRDAFVTSKGEVRLSDGRFISVVGPVAEGAALAYRREATLSGTPYRDSPVEVWTVSPGSKTKHLLRVGAAMGATKLAMISIGCANVAAVAAVLLRLV